MLRPSKISAKPNSMDKRFLDRILDRIIQLNQHDKGKRLMDNLNQAAQAQQPLSGPERASKHADRLREQGYRKAAFWIDPERYTKLRKRYPSATGRGVDWQAVADAALGDEGD